MTTYTVCGPRGACLKGHNGPDDDAALREAMQQCYSRNEYSDGHYIEARKWLGFHEGYERYPETIRVYGPPRRNANAQSIRARRAAGDWDN